MMRFSDWFESKRQIHVISYDKTGRITFSVDGKRYTYFMDAGYFYNGFFKNWIKYKPGKALNFAKENGELIDPMPSKKEPEGKLVQKRLFPY